MLKAARRGLAPDNTAVLRQLSNPGMYANPVVLGLSGEGAQASKGSVAVVLAVPQTGSGATLGRQIAAGALAGIEYLQGKGTQANLKIIDTNQAGWETELRNLPEQYTVIGGPLLPSQYSAVKSSASGRAIFAFTANLPAGEEGAKAWRFFASPQDQVRSLLDAASSIGIVSYGIFAPADNYGKRMSAVFQKEAASRGSKVFAGSYTPNNVQSWTREAADFLKDSEGCNAVFIPDDWKHMEMLIATLQYSGAQKMLFMGTSLWEQPLGAGATSNSAMFTSTVFPGSWYPESSGGASSFKNVIQASGGRPDVWSALGFDFIQMVAELSLLPGWNASQLNSRLARLKADWAGAPFSWDEAGQLHRNLFIFRPEAKGFSYASMPSIGRKLNLQQSSSSSLPTNNADSDIDRLANSIIKN